MSESNLNGAIVWILVDHSAREAAYKEVAQLLESDGATVEIVTITEVLGSAARGAIAGGAERLLRGLRVAVQGRTDEDFLGAMRRARPDLLVITDARYARPLGLVETLTGINALQVGVVSDFQFGAEWLRSPFKGFVVPNQEFKTQLERNGVAGERVIVAGPAVESRFSNAVDREAVRKELKLGDQSVVLVRADTLETATLEKLVFQATLVEKKVRFVFHHQGDSAAAGTLRRAAAQYGLRALMFGKVPDLERYFAAADLVVAHPKEVFIPEIIAQDRPLLLVGDETGAPEQIEFLVRHGAARHVNDLLKLGAVLDDLIETGLQSAQEASDNLSGTSGAADVAEALKVALANREAWKTAAATHQEPAPEDEQNESSPFEEIGGGGAQSSTTSAEYSGLSMAQARDQLANLIMQERDVERRLDEVQKQQERWRGRLNLAREWNEVDLADEAQGILRGYMAEAETIAKELEAIRRQKDKLKAAANPGAAESKRETDDPRVSDVEKRFRKMESESELEGLKDRIRREFGE